MGTIRDAKTISGILWLGSDPAVQGALSESLSTGRGVTTWLRRQLTSTRCPLAP